MSRSRRSDWDSFPSGWNGDLNWSPKRKRRGLIATIAGLGLLWLTLLGLCLASWVYAIVASAQNEEWVFFAVGLLFAPFGVIHGVCHWFGLF